MAEKQARGVDTAGGAGPSAEERVARLLSTGEATRLDGYREKIFLDRYALKDSEGKPKESHPEEMWLRVAQAIASVEPEDRRAHWIGRFYDVLSGFRFVPGGRILSGAGSGTDVTYYNCFVIESPHDSVEGIFQNITRAAHIMRRSGGVGVNLSTLRPRGAYIRTVNGTSSGPCSWGILYSDMTGKVIIQGGSRRGALMLMLDDDHPDVEEFIEYKRRNPGHIDHANLSVAVSDAFMAAVRDDRPWDLKWNGEVWRTVRARDLWRKIAESAHAYAEPGVVFMDRYNKRSNTHYFENIRCVNPCGGAE
jgi:ribonucleoside-diphosphate reductase alpha chain